MPVRLPWPFSPRVEVLPMPEPQPRPMRRRVLAGDLGSRGRPRGSSELHPAAFGDLPRACAATSGPSKAAFTRLTAFVQPYALVSTSLTPAASRIARGALARDDAGARRGGHDLHRARRGRLAHHRVRDGRPDAAGRARGASWRPRRPSRRPAAPRWPCRTRGPRRPRGCRRRSGREKLKRRPPFMTFAERFTLTTSRSGQAIGGDVVDLAAHGAPVISCPA